jgi:hypothetical protein
MQHAIADDVGTPLAFLNLRAQRAQLHAISPIRREELTHRVRIELLTLGIRFEQRRVTPTAGKCAKAMSWATLD